MLVVRHAMKLQDSDLAMARLAHSAFEISHSPVGPRVPGRRNQQGMVHTRLKGKPAPAFIRAFRRAAAPGESNAQPLQNRKGVQVDRIARIGETGWARNAVFEAVRVNRLELPGQLVQITGIHAHVVARVIADLEPVAVQFGNLLPGHVILFVRPKGKTFGDEKGGGESVLLQQRPHYRIMRRHRIVEGEHDELVWNRRREAAGRRLTQRGVNEQNRELDKRSTLPAHPVPERRTTRQQSSLELDFNAQTRMTNDEIRRNDEIRMTKPATAQPTAFGHSGFGFRSSFVIRHSTTYANQVHRPNARAKPRGECLRAANLLNLVPPDALPARSGEH